jgi:sulfite oxidase
MGADTVLEAVQRCGWWCPSENYFQASDYRILPADADPDTAAPGGGISLSSLPLKCDILVPGDDMQIPAGPLA